MEKKKGGPARVGGNERERVGPSLKSREECGRGCSSVGEVPMYMPAIGGAVMRNAHPPRPPHPHPSGIILDGRGWSGGWAAAVQRGGGS